MTHLPPPPVGTVEVILSGDNAGIEWVNHFWCSSAVSAEPTRTQLDTLATSLLGTFQSQFRPLMHNGVLVKQCDIVYYLAGESVLPGLAVNSLAGTRAGSSSTAAVCGVINWHTSFDHYRGGHARSYITGPVTSDFANVATFTTAYQTSLNAAATAWRGAVASYVGAPFTSLALVMLTRIRDKQPLAVPVLRPFTANSVRAVIGTQRRRLT